MAASSKKAGFNELQRDVIGAGLCTACGTCVGACPTQCIRFDYEREEPVLKGTCKPCGTCRAVCPGKDIPMPDLERRLFSRERKVRSELFGISRMKLKGYALDPVVRKTGASGGCTTALLTFALESGMIDGAIVAGMNAEKPWRAEPKLVTTPKEILACAQSKYCVVPNNAVLMEAEKRGLKKLGVVGLACHVHGVRRLQMHGKPEGLASRIALVLGVFCGSNYPHSGTEFIITKFTGIPLDKVKAYSDRGGPESQDIEVTSTDGITKVVPVPKYAFDRFRLRRDRCLMCLDLSAELADVSLGDIFLPLGITKLPGFNAMIVRTELGEALVEEARKHGRIATSPLADSGLVYNIGYELKNNAAPTCLLERRTFGWPTPDYHYEPWREPARYVDEKKAILEQVRDIPEVGEWISQNPLYQQMLAKVDPEIPRIIAEQQTALKAGKR